MEVLQDLLARLPVRHRAALEWFHRHAGTQQPWPNEIETPEGPTLLVTRAKGIYKPAWSEYALSARQVLKSRYPEIGPEFRADGTWTYGYFQENDDPQARDSEYANRGLQRCWQDLVPVGVMRQTRPKPAVRYQIMGLALVAGWDDGYFFFEGFGREDLAHPPGVGTEIELLATITGCDAVEALEAAHIIQYLGPDTNNVQNGLLLRADIHTLFDLGLVAVAPESMTVVIAASLSRTSYRELAGARVREPANLAMRPSWEALRLHREWAGFTG